MAGTCLNQKVTLSAIRLLTLPDTNLALKLTKHTYKGTYTNLRTGA